MSLNQELLNLKINYDAQVDLARKAGLSITNLTKKYEKQKGEAVAASVATQLAAYSQLAGNLSALAQDNKALAVAQAVIDTYAGANVAFKQGGTLGFVTGAAVIAGGLALVNKIRGFERGGRPPVGQPSIVGEKGAELFVPDQAGTIVPNNKLGGTTNVNITILANDTEGFDELLSKRRATVVNIINDALNSQGKEAII